MKKEVLRAVRLKCLDCSAGQIKEVKLCPIDMCALYPYRMGEDPNKKRRGNTQGLKNSRSGSEEITE